MNNKNINIEKVVGHIISVMTKNRDSVTSSDFDNWLKTSPNAKDVTDNLSNSDYIKLSLTNLKHIDKQNSAKKLLARISEKERINRSKRLKRKITITTASIAASLILGVVIYTTTSTTNNTTNIIHTAENILPIETDSCALFISYNGNIQYIGSGDKSNRIEDIIDYSDNSISNTDVQEQKLNTVITPRGVTSKIVLSDSTVVWINENSELKFPSTFKSDNRTVMLKGEAYFEVKSNKKSPFIVINSNQTSVKVLGTKFNISNIKEHTFTTLVEGSVEVSNKTNSVIIKPSQQADIEINKPIEIETVDTNLYTAWKDGKYMFKEKPLIEIMNKLSSWYDMKVIYDNIELENIVLSGSLKKYDSFTQVIDVLEATEMVRVMVIDNNTVKIIKKH